MDLLLFSAYQKKNYKNAFYPKFISYRNLVVQFLKVNAMEFKFNFKKSNINFILS